MVMKDLCTKIKWSQTRKLDTGEVVPTGCDLKPFTWQMLFVMVMISLGGQVIEIK